MRLADVLRVLFPDRPAKPLPTSTQELVRKADDLHHDLREMRRFELIVRRR